MPLRAVLDNINLFAYEQTVESWNKLKNSPERKKLAMPCCGERAIAKTSPLGTFFFAHYRKATDCYAAPESPEHVYLKEIIATSAKAAHWAVITEHPGASPKGDKWVADVFCEKKSAKIAFEVQLSKQTLSEFKYRQARYKESGIRAAWFVSANVAESINHPQSKELPIFVIEDYSIESSIPLVSGFNLPLRDFVRDLLSGHISWKTDPEEMNIHYIKDTCWSCGKPVKQPYGYSIDVYHDVVKTVPNCSTVLEKILGYVGNENLAARGINKISAFPTFKGNAPNFPYCSECLYCGQPQANHYLMQKLKAAREEEAEYAESFVTGECNGRWECANK
ncbi:MAG: hypothetical protein KME48_19890 [Candidatus Thiodiazotropha sp. (ex Ctena orbiculata)]|nr:hypothetical protein [Candidatus Thiodiazotropha taylori]MBT3037229.1 hypothetical protein [Candidatus Thiodiazotropha taylori]